MNCPLLLARKGEQAEQCSSLPRQCQPSSARRPPTTSSQAGAGTGELHRTQPQEQILLSADSTVDFFLAPPGRQIRPQSTTFRHFLHDILWKGALLPLSGMPAWPAGCLRLATRARPGRRVLQGTNKELLAAPAPGVPTPWAPWAPALLRDAWGAPVLPPAGAAPSSGEPAVGHGMRPAAIDLLFRAWPGT